MLNLKRKSTTSALLFAIFVFAFGCGDDSSLIDNQGNNTRVPSNNVAVPAGSKLIHTSSACADKVTCPVDVTFSAAKRIEVQLLDGNDNPISGARIAFDLEVNDAAGTSRTAESAPTNDEGLAAVDIRAGTTQGVAEVIARSSGDDGVEPIKFLVAVNSKDRASYRVSFNHQGTAGLKDINVFLYEGMVTCEDVRTDMVRERDDDPSTNPILTAVSTSVGAVSVDGTMPVVVFPDLANDQSFTVAARAMSRDHNGEVELAFGCEEMNPPVENGVSVDVLVDLRDYLPRFKGSYSVSHTFNIKDAICDPDGSGGYDGVLPSGVCLAIDLIGRLATDPASFFLGRGSGDTGLLGLIVDFLPDGGFKNSIESFLQNSFVNSLGRDALNDFFSSWIDEEAPGWVGGAFDITGAISRTLEELTVEGVIRIAREPDASFDPQSGSVIGLLQADANGDNPGEQVWSDITVYWTGNAGQSPERRTFGAGDLGADGDVIRGTFTGTVVPSNAPENSVYALVIDEHTLSLNYGVLVLGIIERVVLPSIFGQNVTSIELAIQELLAAAVDDGCQGLADSVNKDNNTVNSIVKNLCDNLITSASDGIEDFLTNNLVLGSGGSFVLGTPDGEPCALHQPELYADEWSGKPLPYIKNMGTPSVECTWDVKLQAGSNLIETEGLFNGTRTQF